LGFPIFICIEISQKRAGPARGAISWFRRPRFFARFLIFEMVSDDDESYPLRMLLEAIAVAQAGQYLTRQGQFFVVAVDLRANLII
jgi:hypothetical protein